MGKPTGFLEYTRAATPVRTLDERINDGGEFHQVLTRDVVVEQAARCMDCGVSFCHAGIELDGQSVGCPLRNLIPETNDLVYHGNYHRAFERLSLTHPFPEFTGRVCPALCEGSCTLGEHEPPVTIREIEHYLTELAADEGWIKPRIPAVRINKTIGVVGSGPAGLAAADLLNQLGYGVVIYERADRAGGLLTYGIPTMKLDKAVVQRRIDLLMAEGVQFVLNTEIGSDGTPGDLLAKHDAVVLATGSTVPLTMNVPGIDGTGVLLAVDYLTAATRAEIDGVALPVGYDGAGLDVIVLGAGDTSTDCVATALRQKAKSIIQFQRGAKAPEQRPANDPWPLQPKTFSTDYGQLESGLVYGGDPREYETSVVEVLRGNDGTIAGVKTIKYQTEYIDGKRKVTPIPGTEEERACGLLLVAMGFRGPEQALPKALGLELTARGNIATELGSYATNVPGIFTAGDAHRGQSLVVWAIKEGRDAALECHKYLLEKLMGS